MTADQVGLLTAKRLNLPPSARLSLQTMIPAALANLAKSYARDPNKRNNLMTDKASVTASVTTSNQYNIVDISTVLSTNNVMLETLKYGTVWHKYATKTFTGGDVSLGSDSVNIANHNFPSQLKVRLTTTGALPTGLSINTDYYIIVVDTDSIKFAASRADAEAGTAVDMSAIGSGTDTITPWTESILQWVQSPTQGNLASCLPFDYVTGYLVAENIYVNVTSGTLAFTVPYLPTLATLPDDEDVEADLIDHMVALVETGDPAKIEPE